MNKSMLLSPIFVLATLTCSFAQTSNDLETAVELSQQGKWGESIPLLEKVVAVSQENPEAYYYLGRAYLVLDNHKKAIDNLKRAVKLANDVSDYHFWLGQAYGLKLTNSGGIKRLFLAPKVKGQYKKALKLDPDHVQARKQLAYYYAEAPGIAGGNLDKAHELATELVKVEEKHGLRLLALIFEKKDVADSSLYYYGQLETKYGDLPDFYAFYNDYGYLLLKEKQYEASISRFKKQVELAPGQPNAHDSLGDGYRAAGKLQQALAEYQKAIQLDSNLKVSKKNCTLFKKSWIDSRKGN